VQNYHMNRSAMLRFSLKYQIPSLQTALLAVPQEEMKLFKAKAAEYRRKQLEDARRQRQWQKDRKLNWSRSSGGDPEIRVPYPEATRVYAVLPDGRTFDLSKASDGYWGGNFDIPADAPEGEYKVRIVAENPNESTSDQFVTYSVDRTPPTGTLEVLSGFWSVHSEAGLAKAVAVFGNGDEETLVETQPGLYQLPVDHRRLVKVVLFDNAHNHSELTWS